MIIAINGHKQSGKDTVGKIIKYLMYRKVRNITNPITEEDYLKFTYDMSNIDSNWTIKKFAGKLKECVSIITGYSLEELEKEDIKNVVIFTRYYVHSKLQGQLSGKVSPYYASEEEAKMAKYAMATHLGIDTTVLTIVPQDVTIRVLLQELGTDVGRSIYSALWIWSTMKDYVHHSMTEVICDRNGVAFVIPPGHGEYSGTVCNTPVAQYHHIPKLPDWIITDLRFPNELEACRKKGAITIKVKRNIYEYCGSRYDWDTLCSVVFKDTGETPTRAYAEKNLLIVDNHESETALDNVELDYTIDNNGSLNKLIDAVERILKLENII